MKSVLSGSNQEKPKREPDFTAVEKMASNQAFIYRLTGDKNKLHVDANESKTVGFEKPIIHGLCTYGFSARAVYDRYGKGNPASMSKIAGRFTSHVFPGETLIIEMWEKKPNFIYFETKTKERGLTSLKGYVEFKDETPAKL